MNPHRLLIVHEDPQTLSLLTSMLQTMGHRIEEARNDRAAVRLIDQQPPSLVVAGADPNSDEALEFLVYLRRKHPSVPVVLVFASTHPERAREAMVRGASAVLRYPFPATQLRGAVSQALQVPEQEAIHNGNGNVYGNGNGNGNGHCIAGNGIDTANGHAWRHELNFGAGAAPVRENGVAGPGFANGHAHAGELKGEMIGDDPSLRQAIELAGTISPTRAPVLIVGERGTGKTLLARTMHARSPRRDGPFVELSCSALREAALEIELFGRKSSHLGEPERQGKVAQAHGGLLLLDDVESLSPALQYKLLRLIRDGEYEAVGSNQTLRADVRVVVGTNDDLSARVRVGEFRQDLYYRISVITLKLPPLRHRGGDIEKLAEHFRHRFSREIGRSVAAFSPDAIERLNAHEWPGNVHELEHVVQQAVVLCRGSRVEVNHIVFNAPAPAHAAAGRLNGPGTNRMPKPHVAVGILPLKEALEVPEKQIILQALEALNWNRQETAKVLDINRTTLYKKMKKYGLLLDDAVWLN